MPFPAARAGLSASLMVGLTAGLMTLAAPAPVWAQLTSRDQGEVMTPGDISRDVDPYPFDARVAFSTFLRRRLPSQWWAGDPTYEFGGLSVVVHVPEIWNGNPTSAMQRYCPPVYDEIWRSVRQIELRPMYKQVPWAATVCRR